MAKDCKEEKDTCGTCGGKHQHSNCNAYHTYRCVNCRSREHGSSDREYPEYIAQRDALNTHTPENPMPFFPMEEPWTQVLLPPKPPGPIIHSQPPPPPSTTHQPDVAAIQQRTINWMLKRQAEKTGQPSTAPVINGRMLIPLGRKKPRNPSSQTGSAPYNTPPVPSPPPEPTPDQHEPCETSDEESHTHPQPFPTISPLHFPGSLPFTPSLHNPPVQQEPTSSPPPSTLF